MSKKEILLQKQLQLKNLDKINNHHEHIFKLFGLNCNHMDQSSICSLNNLVNLQQKTGLIEADVTFLIDWYVDTLDEALPEKLAIKKLMRETENIEDDAISYEIKGQETKDFTSKILRKTKSKEELEQFLMEMRKENDKLVAQKNAVTQIKDDIDELIDMANELDK